MRGCGKIDDAHHVAMQDGRGMAVEGGHGAWQQLWLAAGVYRSKTPRGNQPCGTRDKAADKPASVEIHCMGFLKLLCHKWVELPGFANKQTGN